MCIQNEIEIVIRFKQKVFCNRQINMMNVTNKTYWIIMWLIKWLDCYYLGSRVRDMGQAAKALVRSCQDILTPALCGGLP